MGHFILGAAIWLGITYAALRFIPLKHTSKVVAAVAIIMAYRQATNEWWWQDPDFCTRSYESPVS